MALTELQLPTKDSLYNDMRTLATEMERYLLRWEQASEFLAAIEVSDLDALAVPTGQVRTDLAQFREAVDDVISVYRGNAVTPANNPSVVMDRIRRMLVI